MNAPPFSTIHPNVHLGENCRLDSHVVLGTPPDRSEPGEHALRIGRDSIIRSHTIIYAGNRIGHGFVTGHYVFIREDNTIGNDVSIGTHTVIEHHVTIGNGVRLHSQVFVPEFSVLEEGCWIGPNVVLTNAPYPKAPRVKEFLNGPCICRSAVVGANATLLPGVVIGEGALVGAGSVVTCNVAPLTVVAGNPARKIKDVADLKHPDGDKAYHHEAFNV